jgi:hypothetical protein
MAHHDWQTQAVRFAHDMGGQVRERHASLDGTLDHGIDL